MRTSRSMSPICGHPRFGMRTSGWSHAHTGGLRALLVRYALIFGRTRDKYSEEAVPCVEPRTPSGPHARWPSLLPRRPAAGAAAAVAAAPVVAAVGPAGS